MKRLVCACAVSLAVAAAARAQTPAGDDFRVNTYTTEQQFISRPAMEPDGDFVVAWTSYEQDGDLAGVFAQRFAASGAPRGGEFRVNSYTTDRQSVPTVAVGRKGDFSVVWHAAQDGSGASIHGQRYDPSGNGVGGEFQVNTYTTNYQYSPHIARGASWCGRAGTSTAACRAWSRGGSTPRVTPSVTISW
jgi:hypothetical protein